MGPVVGFEAPKSATKLGERATAGQFEETSMHWFRFAPISLALASFLAGAPPAAALDTMDYVPFCANHLQERVKLCLRRLSRPPQQPGNGFGIRFGHVHQPQPRCPALQLVVRRNNQRRDDRPLYRAAAGGFDRTGRREYGCWSGRPPICRSGVANHRIGRCPVEPDQLHLLCQRPAIACSALMGRHATSRVAGDYGSRDAARVLCNSHNCQFWKPPACRVSTSCAGPSVRMGRPPKLK
jgi:hypothetical protein